MNAIMLRGDARHLPLPDASVDLIVTSPPYWVQRDYGYDGQLGSEATPAEWLANLIDCTRDWVRVLKPEGSLFVNLGDKFATRYSSQRGRGRAGLNGDDGTRDRSGQNHTGSGEKSLLGLPWRYALACTDQLGLILRRDIVWSKPDGLPESVTDRCRSSHEYLFHLVKQPRYYAAVDEIREPQVQARGFQRDRANSANPGAGPKDDAGLVRKWNPAVMNWNPLGKLPGSVWRMPDDDTVWDIASQPLTVPAHLGVDHFAAFPMELPRRCVLGWSPPGICVECGEGRRPVVVRGPQPPEPVHRQANRLAPGQAGNGTIGFRNSKLSGQEWNAFRAANPDTITGYACACPTPDAPTRPAIVLDPFGGTGTAALVASMHGRIGVSIDRSADYTRLARWRCTDPGERAKALQVPKPPPIPDGMEALF